MCTNIVALLVKWQNNYDHGSIKVLQNVIQLTTFLTLHNLVQDKFIIYSIYKNSNQHHGNACQPKVVLNCTLLN
ncbi:hypothetical protein XENTR_v10013481 [Xenopus tropicalis]|nr:hypothetical protein XENTR_v10013481 [Xenopus tropicalis]